MKKRRQILLGMVLSGAVLMLPVTASAVTTPAATGTSTSTGVVASDSKTGPLCMNKGAGDCLHLNGDDFVVDKFINLKPRSSSSAEDVRFVPTSEPNCISDKVTYQSTGFPPTLQTCPYSTQSQDKTQVGDKLYKIQFVANPKWCVATKLLPPPPLSVGGPSKKVVLRECSDGYGTVWVRNGYALTNVRTTNGFSDGFYDLTSEDVGNPRHYDQLTLEPWPFISKDVRDFQWGH